MTNEEYREELLRDYKEMALQLHGYHSNVGPTKREEEWKICTYRYCRKRYQMAHPSQLQREAIVV